MLAPAQMTHSTSVYVFDPQGNLFSSTEFRERLVKMAAEANLTKKFTKAKLISIFVIFFSSFQLHC